MSIKFRCPKCNSKVKFEDEMGRQVAKCPDCGSDISVPPSKKQKREEKSREMEDEKRAKEEAARRLEEKKQSIVISTGDIKREYKILSIVFAAGIRKYGGKGLLDGDSTRLSNKKYNGLIQKVYNEAISVFREKAVKVGADAIIHAKFDIEQIELFEKGMVSSGNALRIQVFCTGTAVRYI